MTHSYTQLETIFLSGHVHPLPGRSILLLYDPPRFAGKIHLPDSAQHRGIKDIMYRAKVCDVRWKEDEDKNYVIGQDVLVVLTGEDLDRSVIVARNERIWATIESVDPTN